MKLAQRASRLTLVVGLAFLVAGCAQIRERFGHGPEDGSCGPDGCNIESGESPQQANSFQSGSGSDVFGGNMSSPARGFQGSFN